MTEKERKRERDKERKREREKERKREREKERKRERETERLIETQRVWEILDFVSYIQVNKYFPSW